MQRRQRQPQARRLKRIARRPPPRHKNGLRDQRIIPKRESPVEKIG